MSLVGTRPPTVDEWDKYELHHRARLATKPGLTGMWQVSGRSNITDFEEVVKLDKQYISEWTIENIIMFIPFGLLAPMVFERMRKVRFCVFIGFLCSCGIELSQLITQRGYCQLDDVVTNTVGMLVGWGIWKMLSSVGMAENPLF